MSASFLLAQTVLATEKSASLSCKKYILKAEQNLGIPPGLLSAISLIESGKAAPGHEDLVAWPWVINVEGKPEYHKTKTEAVKALNKHLDAGILNIDVGCMQINYRHHGAEFKSPAYMMDPRRNVDYAAKFLRALRQQHNSWTKAVGHYHSATLKHQVPYRHKVYNKWQKVRHQENKMTHNDPHMLRPNSQGQGKGRALRPLSSNPAACQTGYEVIRPKQPVVPTPTAPTPHKKEAQQSSYEASLIKRLPKFFGK